MRGGRRKKGNWNIGPYPVHQKEGPPVGRHGEGPV